jgi:hypothetical protein
MNSILNWHLSKNFRKQKFLGYSKAGQTFLIKKWNKEEMKLTAHVRTLNVKQSLGREKAEQNSFATTVHSPTEQCIFE